MKSLNVITPKTWAVGDKRDFTESQLEALVDEDLFDSYDQSYEIDNLRWKVVHRTASRDGSTLYTLAAMEEA